MLLLTVNPNGIKTLLVNGLSTFPIKGKSVFSNGPKILPRNLMQNENENFMKIIKILCNWVFDNFILAKELFAKALQSLETCVLVNNNLCRKLFSSVASPTTFDECTNNIWRMF